jgi:hypothetical protein
MATRKQKEQLMETLKFTPRNITVNLSGYGGEIVMGRIDKATYDYWSKRDDFEEYATCWDADEDFPEVPEECRFIDNGSWYECDHHAHETGVEMSDECAITVTDSETGSVIFQSRLGPGTLEDQGIAVNFYEDIDVDDFPGEGVFVGQNFEKGTFFECEFEITKPFDLTKLQFTYSTYDSWSILDSLSYDGEDLEGSDAYSTSGKSTSYEIYWNDPVVESLEGEETQAQRLIDESDVGPWHDTEDHNPVHLGYYDCRVLSTVWPEQRLQWDGMGWRQDNGDPMRLHVSHWRGLNNPV